MADLDYLREAKLDPRYFVATTWDLKAQPPKPEFEELVEKYLDLGQFDLIGPQHYGDFDPITNEWRWWSFQKGLHWTWQQNLILTAVYRAVNGLSVKRISIKSGHGTGKSTTMAWILLWFLFAFYDSMVPCTAPTASQMHDVLWKECMKWIQEMPKGLSNQYNWQGGYIRIKDRPETWFARARTATKDNPEALAGLHAPHMLFGIDEASAVPEETFSTSEGSLTEKNSFVLMISNPTRLIGYFYDSQHKDKDAWQRLSLNSEYSPIVDKAYKERIASKHGIDSDEYRIRVRGEFGREDSVDKQGYVQLFQRKNINIVQGMIGFAGPLRLGIDPSGQGQNKTEWVIRDAFQMKSVMSQEVSDEKGIALITHGIVEEYHIPKTEVYIDSFGVGAKVIPHLYRLGIEVQAVNVGDPINEKTKGFDPTKYEMEFLNLRAYAYWEMYNWGCSGGRFIGSDKDWDELLSIRSRRNLQNKFQIMPKHEMMKEGLASPDRADAGMLTFCNLEPLSVVDPGENSISEGWSAEQEEEFDPHSSF